MIEVTILVPLASNDGERFAAAHHAMFEAQILERFGGLTRMPQAVEGLWVDEGRTYQDVLVVYKVAMASITDGGKLGEVIDFAKGLYGQRAIYVAYLGVSEIL